MCWPTFFIIGLSEIGLGPWRGENSWFDFDFDWLITQFSQFIPCLLASNPSDLVRSAWQEFRFTSSIWFGPNEAAGRSRSLNLKKRGFREANLINHGPSPRTDQEQCPIDRDWVVKSGWELQFGGRRNHRVEHRPTREGKNCTRKWFCAPD